MFLNTAAKCYVASSQKIHQSQMEGLRDFETAMAIILLDLVPGTFRICTPGTVGIHHCSLASGSHSSPAMRFVHDLPATFGAGISQDKYVQSIANDRLNKLNVLNNVST
jgi:hypothetical protein